MNKIEVVNNKIICNFPIITNDNNITLKDCNLIIIYKNSNMNFNFNILSNVDLFEYYLNSNCNNTYDLNKNSNFTFNRFGNDCSLITTINMKENSNVFYKYSSINFKNNNYLININHNGHNTNSKIINYGINFTNSKLDFLINSHILKNSLNSSTIQDSKIILMNDNNSSIKPNLIIDNNEINANHSAYLGHFQEEKLFYLKSRGINMGDCLKLLTKAFLISNMDIDFSCKNIILQDLNKFWR